MFPENCSGSCKTVRSGNKILLAAAVQHCCRSLGLMVPTTWKFSINAPIVLKTRPSGEKFTPLQNYRIQPDNFHAPATNIGMLPSSSAPGDASTLQMSTLQNIMQSPCQNERLGLCSSRSGLCGFGSKSGRNERPFSDRRTYSLVTFRVWRSCRKRKRTGRRIFPTGYPGNIR